MSASTCSTITRRTALLTFVTAFSAIACACSRHALSGLDEARDKNGLLELIHLGTNAEWVLAIDGDELLLDHAELLSTIQSGRAGATPWRPLYLWDREDRSGPDGASMGASGGRRCFVWVRGKFSVHKHTAEIFYCGNVPKN